MCIVFIVFDLKYFCKIVLVNYCYVVILLGL